MNVHVHIDHLVVDAGAGAQAGTARFEAQLRAALTEQLALRLPSLATDHWQQFHDAPSLTMPLEARSGSLAQQVGQALGAGLAAGNGARYTRGSRP